MSDEEPAKTFAVNLRDPLLALFASSVELIIKRVVVVDNVFICFFHVVTIPHNRTKVKMFLSFFFFFIVIFFHFLLDKVFSKNLCKSLAINELRSAGFPAPRKSLTLR